MSNVPSSDELKATGGYGELGLLKIKCRSLGCRMTENRKPGECLSLAQQFQDNLAKFPTGSNLVAFAWQFIQELSEKHTDPAFAECRGGLIFLFSMDLALPEGPFSHKQKRLLAKWREVFRKTDFVTPEVIVTDEDRANPPDRLRRVEHILRARTSRIVLVLEKSYDSHNHMAILRSAECFGIQHIWMVDAVEMKQKNFNVKVTRGSTEWLSVRHFSTTAACIEALRSDGRTIWATDLCHSADLLDYETSKTLKIPSRLAVVMGREADGVSQAMLDAADRRIFLPMYGFADSFNLSVSAALLLQYLFFLCPEARGAMSEEERHELRKVWYVKLARNEHQKLLYPYFVDHPPEPLGDVRRPEKSVKVPPKIVRRIRAKELARESKENESLGAIDALTESMGDLCKTGVNGDSIPDAPVHAKSLSQNCASHVRLEQSNGVERTIEKDISQKR